METLIMFGFIIGLTVGLPSGWLACKYWNKVSSLGKKVGGVFSPPKE